MNFFNITSKRYSLIKLGDTRATGNIKTLLLALSFAFLSSGHLVAQGMPVYDNTNFISLAKQLIESAKQTSQLLKTVDFLRQQKDRIEQVSSIIKQLDAVNKLIANNRKLFDMVQNDLQQILNSSYIKPHEVEKVIASFNEIIDRSMQSVAYVDKILTSDYLKMSDAERAAILKDYETQSNEMVAEVAAKTKRYKEIISFRSMQDKINNRQTQY